MGIFVMLEMLFFGISQNNVGHRTETFGCNFLKHSQFFLENVHGMRQNFLKF